MKFEASELPYTQFEALGMKKLDVLKMKPSDLNALLSGRRTELNRFKDIKLSDNNTLPVLDAKLSLDRNIDTPD